MHEYKNMQSAEDVQALLLRERNDVHHDFGWYYDVASEANVRQKLLFVRDAPHFFAPQQKPGHAHKFARFRVLHEHAVLRVQRLLQSLVP